MKKHIFLKLPVLIPNLLFLFALAGCSLTSATAVQYVSPAPPEKNCTLYVSAAFTVKKFDGQDVEWRAGFGNMWAMVRIPEGSHTFDLYYETSAGAGTIATYRGSASVTYERFVAGHTYLLASRIVSSSSTSRTRTVQTGVKDVTNEPDWGSLSKGMSMQGFEWLPVN